MQGVKAVQSNKQQTKHMKTLTKLALAAVILASTLAAQAGWVSGYTRSNGTYVQPHYRSDAGSGSFGGGSSGSSYAYRNPCAAYPSERVSSYTRPDATTVRVVRGFKTGKTRSCAAASRWLGRIIRRI
jgi:hypothetical protein